MREFWPTYTQLWREMAHFPAGLIMAADRLGPLCQRRDVDRPSSKRAVPHCQYRYPSPRRSGPSGSRPTPSGFVRIGEICQSRERREKLLVLAGDCADSAPYKTKQNKGSKTCKHSVFFSPQRPSRRFRPVSTMTFSVVPWVPQQAPSSLTPLAQTLSPALSLVASPVACATKSPRSAVKASQGRTALTQHFCRTPGPLRGAGVFAARSTAPTHTINDMGGANPAGDFRQVGRAI